MAPTRKKNPKLGVNGKDCDDAIKGPADFRRNWVANNEFDIHNHRLEVAPNRKDHGFNHLDIVVPEHSAIDDFLDLPASYISNKETESEYLACVRDKLRLAKNFIFKEKKLGLNPDRCGIHKEPVAIALSKGPIKIDMSAQQSLRLLLDEEARLRKFTLEKTEIDSEVEKSMEKYWFFWMSLRTALTFQMSGKNEKQMERHADAIMEEVLKKIVEPLNSP